VDGATTYPSGPYGVTPADRVARRRGNGKPTDRTADGDHAGEGGKVAKPFSTRQHRRSAEGCSTSGQTRHDHRSLGEESGGHDTAPETARCDSLEHAHHGGSSGNQRGKCATHLACAWFKAAPGANLQAQPRSRVQRHSGKGKARSQVPQ
jgi:hypothetical protein